MCICSPYSSVPEKPSDLPHFICRAPKPILKPSTAPILVKEMSPKEDDDEEEIPEPFEDPCSETVVEKAETVEEKVETDEEPAKRVSKFKAMRAGRK